MYTEEQLLKDPTISDWLKKQIVESYNRDILDATRDAELLLSVLEQRCLQLGLLNKQ
jgi:hypothetical protein